jgi:hypothetical protein
MSWLSNQLKKCTGCQERKKTMSEAWKRMTEERMRKNRELAAIQEAKRTGKNISYIDDDGCEVTVTASGHSFYNAADWY